MTSTTIDRWDAALDEFAAYRARAQISAASIRAHVAALRRLHAHTHVAPYAVTAEDVTQWLSVRPLAPSTRRSYVAAVTAFYSFAERVGHIDRSPMRRVRTASPVAASWEHALQQWMAHEQRRGVAETTIAMRAKVLRLFAAEVAIDPWCVEVPTVDQWLAAPGLASTTRQGRANSLRAFYRWAWVAQLVHTDPTEAPSRRATTLLANPAWERHIEAFRRALRAEGMPETSIGLRLKQLRRFAREIAAASPAEVDTATIIDWLANKRWANATRRSHRAAIAGFYARNVAHGLLEHNPATELPKIRADHHVARPASEEAISFGLASSNALDRLAIRLAAELGLRCAEVAVLHSNDLRSATEPGADKTARSWIVVHGKGRKQRMLPVPTELAGLLRSRPPGFVFPGRINGHVSPHTMSKRISQALPAGVTMHMLRHRFATRAYNVDRDVFTVQQLLGHASPATTQGYVQVNSDHMRRLVEAIA